MKVWITGAGGMLGKDLVKVFKRAGHTVTATDRHTVDIADASSIDSVVESFLLEGGPDVIVNAAAYNAVDLAEDEEGYKMAMAINVEGVRNLAQIATVIGARFVHYSTDYVFSGTKGAPYVEGDATDPISKYGESKALGEKAAQEACANAIIFRVSKLFGVQGRGASAKRSFVDIMLQKAKAGEPLTIVDDEVGCPTYTPHIAEATLAALDRNYNPGIYHMVNEGEGVTWYQFAKEIFEVAGLNPQMTPVSGDAFPRKAKRPHAAVLKNTKLPALPSRMDALRAYIETLA